jgi:4-amino-4-deoxy-L-arabinose transferase-like glycosyltransferase
VPDYDSAKHLLFSWDYADHLTDWDLAEPVTSYTGYPPVLHVVGAVATLIAGRNVAPPILAVALVFGPLLVLGVYRAGALLGNRWSGALAAVFVIGTPMIVTEFRAYMVESAATALLAVATCLLVAGRRFERIGLAALAGLAVGLGQLTKETFVFFVAGFVAVQVLRGGWRNWPGLLAFASVATLVAAPWYVLHWHDLQLTGAWAQVSGAEGPQWGTRSLSYYSWSVVTRQLMLPLSLLSAAGATISCWRFVRHPRADDHTPELVAGLLVGWAALTVYLHVKAPYYALPLTVYIALLGTTWLASGRGQWSRPASLAIITVATLNFVVAAFHATNSPGVRVSLPRARESDQGLQGVGFATLVSGDAWPPTLGPGPHGDILDLMRALRRRGVRTVEFDLDVELTYFNPTGLTAFARIAGLRRRIRFDPFDPLQHRGPRFDLNRLRAPRDAFIGLEPPARAARGCRQLGEGNSIFVTLGPPSRRRRICPPG